jgi:hypothetical protein
MTLILFKDKSKIAEGRPLHDGLGSHEPHARVKTGDQRRIPVAGQAVTVIFDALPVVQLGVTAACHIKTQHLAGLFQKGELQSIVFGPDFSDEAQKVWQAISTVLLSQAFASQISVFLNCVKGQLHGRFISQLADKLANDTGEERSLDLAVLKVCYAI